MNLQEPLSAALIALEPIASDDWLDEAVSCTRSIGMGTFTRGRELLAWCDPKWAGQIQYADGWSFCRIWLADHRGALAVIPRRIYFRADAVDERPEHEVLGTVARPLGPPASKQVDVLWDLTKRLLTRLPGGVRVVDLDIVDFDLGRHRLSVIGAAEAPAGQSADRNYKEVGFDFVPPDFTVTICPLEGTSRGIAEEFASRIHEAARRRRTIVRTAVTTTANVEHRIEHLEGTEEPARPGRCVLFVLPSKQCHPSEETVALFLRLERCCVPFRRAYADDPLDFSAADQLPSLLLAAGGTPHRSPVRIHNRPVWTVGLDLGHPVGIECSTVAIVLVDPEGRFVRGWVAEQAKDETLRWDVVSPMLAACVAEVHSRASRPAVVLIRDGRVFENEHARRTLAMFGDEASLIEYRKGRNPQIVCRRSESVSAVPDLATRLKGTNTMFISGAPPRDDRTLPAVAKVTWRPEWNGLGLDARDVACLLAASSAAPGLGLRGHHLPAAIYWADGLTRRSVKDLRFWGLPVHRAGDKLPPGE